MRLRVRPPANGFVLPLAISTSIVLLIGSASLHTLALQARSRGRLQLQLHQREDQLRAAAMTFLQRASEPGDACLLAWPSSHWEGLTSFCEEASLERLRSGAVHTGTPTWRLIAWEPDGNGATLSLALEAEPAAARFRLDRAQGQWRLQDGLQRLPVSEPAS